MSLKTDPTDRKILVELQKNARLTNLELAERIGLSPSSCLRRVKALEQSKIIRDYVTRIDAERMGFARSIYVQITLRTQQGDALADFERAVGKIPEVMECCLMAGSADYLLRLRVRDMDDYERVHLRGLTQLPNVERVYTQFVVRDVLRRNALPL